MGVSIFNFFKDFCHRIISFKNSNKNLSLYCALFLVLLTPFLIFLYIYLNNVQVNFLLPSNYIDLLKKQKYFHNNFFKKIETLFFSVSSIELSLKTINPFKLNINIFDLNINPLKSRTHKPELTPFQATNSTFSLNPIPINNNEQFSLRLMIFNLFLKM